MTYPSDLAMTQLSTLKNFLDPSPQNGIAGVTITAPGTAYTSATGTIVDSTGTGASLGPATISAGGVITFPIVSRGQNYLNPTLVITGDGTGAAGTVALGADFMLSFLIKAVSSKILNGTNLDAIYDSGVDIPETRNGNGKSQITPHVTPVTAVTSVTIDGIAIAPSVSRSSGFLFDKNTIYLIGYAFSRGVQNVVLTYKAGIAAGSAIAADLELGCLTTAALQWKKRPHIEYLTESVNQGLGTHSFVVDELSKEAHGVINQIRRVAVDLD